MEKVLEGGSLLELCIMTDWKMFLDSMNFSIKVHSFTRVFVTVFYFFFWMKFLMHLNCNV